MKKEFLLSLVVKVCYDILGPERVIRSAFLLREFTSLRSFIRTKVPRATLAELTLGALPAQKVMAEAQAKLRLKRAIKHQSPNMQRYMYPSGDKILVWSQKIVNNRIGEFIGPFIVLHHDECSNIVAKDQDAAIRRYTLFVA